MESVGGRKPAASRWMAFVRWRYSPSPAMESVGGRKPAAARWMAGAEPATGSIEPVANRKKRPRSAGLAGLVGVKLHLGTCWVGGERTGACSYTP